MSDKVRVYEIAEEVGSTSAEVISEAKKLKIELKSPQSAVSFEDAEEITNFIISGKSSRLKEKEIINKIKEPPKIERKITLNKKSIKNKFLSLEEIKKSFNRTLPSIKKEKFELIKFPNIKITISNLKSINNFSWEINDKQNLYVIIGENGTGKSSILLSIAKLVKPSIFKEEFIGKGFEDTIIKYEINEKNIIWIKDPYWKEESQDNYEMPKLNGFLESSILTGTRFKYIDKYMKDDLEVEENDDISSADSFIKENMNYILNNNDNKKFNDLFEINAIRKKKLNNKTFHDKKYSFFALKSKENYIKEFFFSTGEYFLLSLLKFILVNKEKTSAIPALIIIDEIELSLHPLAQKRLMEKIYEFSDEFNLLIIFATHSLQIIENTRPEHLYYIKKGKVSNNHSISNPIYPGFLTSRLYNHQYFDKIILVEDNCAMHFTNFIIKNLATISPNISYKILPIGDWKKVLDTAKDNLIFKFYGNAQILAIVDEDKKKEAYENPNYKTINKTHLPVKDNIEKFIIKLLNQEDEQLISYIENIIIPNPYDKIQLKIISIDKSSHIKSAFHALLKAISEFTSSSTSQFTYIEAEKEIVNFVYNKIKDTAECNKFKKQLSDFVK
jgi:ABC-type dipeptide/oligopeptide/nickel transport system ATPase component